jgi:peptidyl-dipeptidase A
MINLISLLLAGSISSLPLESQTTFSLTTADFLAYADSVLTKVDTLNQLASWSYETNITDSNQQHVTTMSLKYNQVLSNLVEKSMQYQPKNELESRLLEKLKRMSFGIPTLKQDQQKLSEVVARLTSIYSTERYNNMTLEPDLTAILSSSRDYDVLLDAYIGWRNVTGPKMKNLYAEYVKLMNLGAQQSGSFNDAGEFWRSGYDLPPDEFTEMIESLWNQVLPFYEQLHCYTGRKLAKQYGDRVLMEDGLLPSHLFGDMWSQGFSICSFSRLDQYQ